MVSTPESVEIAFDEKEHFQFPKSVARNLDQE